MARKSKPPVEGTTKEAYRNMKRESLILPLTRQEQIRIKAYKHLAKHYNSLAERAESRAFDIQNGDLGHRKVYRPDKVEDIIRCPYCGGRLIHHGCMLCRCEFVDCDYVFGFDDYTGTPNHRMINPNLPTNYEEYKQKRMIVITDPKFFELLLGNQARGPAEIQRGRSPGLDHAEGGFREIPGDEGRVVETRRP